MNESKNKERKEKKEWDKMKRKNKWNVEGRNERGERESDQQGREIERMKERRIVENRWWRNKRKKRKEKIMNKFQSKGKSKGGKEWKWKRISKPRKNKKSKIENNRKNRLKEWQNTSWEDRSETNKKKIAFICTFALSAGAVEYTDCTSANECPRYDTKQSDGEVLDMTIWWWGPRYDNLMVSVLDMILNNLMVRFQWCWSFGECRVLFHCHRSQFHSGP